MTLLLALWLLSFGVSLGVAGLLTYQWWTSRPSRRPVVLDDYSERLRVLDQPPDPRLSETKDGGIPRDLRRVP